MRIDELIDPGSEQFQKWFQGSKVADRDGNPIMMYHATDAGSDFKTFKPMSHFGDLETAHDIIDIRLMGKAQSAIDSDEEDLSRPILQGGTISHIPDEERAKVLRSIVSKMRIIPVYLSIKNPMVLADSGDQHSAWRIVKQMYDLGIIGKEMKDKVFQQWKNEFDETNPGWQFGYNRSHGNKQDALQWERGEKTRMNALVKFVNKLGYDGFYYKNTMEGAGSLSWVPLTNRQVKFAI